MRKHSLSETHKLYFISGVLAAHANSPELGFRQKDLRFYIELFSNWMESTLKDSSLLIHNAQISRFLIEMEKNGLIKKLRSSSPPRYQLTRVGVIELFSTLVSPEEILPLEHFYFLHYVIDNYGNQIADLANQDRGLFSGSLKIEFDSLRDPKRLIEKQIRFVDREISKLALRIDEGLKASQLAIEKFKKNHSLKEVIEEITKKYPYELNNQKPLPELMSEIPESRSRWELEQGALERAHKLWTPLKSYFESYRASLLQIRSRQDG